MMCRDPRLPRALRSARLSGLLPLLACPLALLAGCGSATPEDRPRRAVSAPAELRESTRSRSTFEIAESLQVESADVAERELYVRLLDSLALAGDEPGAWRARLHLADVWVRGGYNRDALATAEQALALTRGDPAREGWSRYVIARARLGLGELALARWEAERALELAARVADPAFEALVQTVLGTVDWRRGRCAEALAARERAVHLRRDLADALDGSPTQPGLRLALQDLAKALEDAGEAYRCPGRIADAALAYDEAVRLFRRVRDPWGEARAFFQLAKLRSASGELEEVAGLLRKADVFLTDLPGKQWDEKRLMYNAIAELYTRAGNADRGRDPLVYSLIWCWPAASPSNTGDRDPPCSPFWPHERVQSWELEGRLELAAGRPAEARKSLENAVFYADSFDFLRLRASARAVLARVETELGRTGQALALAEKAVDLADSIGDAEITLEALEARAIALEASGSPAAGAAYLRALETLESWRGRLSLEDVRVGLAESRLGIYEGAIRHLIETGEPERAFEVAERARARLLLELMAETSRRATVPTAGRDGTGSLPPPASLAEPSGLAEIREGLLRPGRALLAFFWGERDVYGWWIEKGSARGMRLGSTVSLMPLAGFLRGALEDPSAGPDWKPPALRAYRELVAPLSPGPADEILVVADGPLAYVPLEALIPAPGAAPWGLGRRLIYGPSASVLLGLAAFPRARSWERAVLALGDPELGPREPAGDAARGGDPAEASEPPLSALPHAAAEARAIQRMFRFDGADLLLGAQATVGEWRDHDPGRYRYLHFATHARVNSIEPARTHLVLAGDRLGLAEIRALQLTAELVTLSACETALGRRVRGEGILGLPHAFLASGAQGVLVTLWRIDDRAAAAFMQDFYAEVRAGKPPAEALLAVRQSRLAAGGPLAHPSRWAPFVLIGGMTDGAPAGNRGGPGG